jgi:hypothetical protein
MAEAVSQERPLTLDDLTAYFAQGSKPKDQFRVGAEHEKFGFYLEGPHARSLRGRQGRARPADRPAALRLEAGHGRRRSSGWSATAPMSAWSRAASSSFPARRC